MCYCEKRKEDLDLEREMVGDRRLKSDDGRDQPFDFLKYLPYLTLGTRENSLSGSR